MRRKRFNFELKAGLILLTVLSCLPSSIFYTYASLTGMIPSKAVWFQIDPATGFSNHHGPWHYEWQQDVIFLPTEFLVSLCTVTLLCALYAQCVAIFRRKKADKAFSQVLSLFTLASAQAAYLYFFVVCIFWTID